MARFAFLTALLLALGLAPSARAATLITIGHGFYPAIAVDEAGTAYIAWSGTESPRTLRFCRLPRGAKACDVSRAIAAPGDSASPNFVFFVNGGGISVLSGRFGDTPSGTYAFRSNDRGANFGPGTVISSLRFQDATAGPGTTITGADAYGRFQNVSTDGASAATPPLTFAPGDWSLGSAGLAPSGEPVVVFAAGGLSSGASFRRFSGSGALSEQSSWTPATSIGAPGEPHLADGPAGLYLQSDAGSITVRKWTGSGFGSPVTVGTGVGPHSWLTQDGKGRLHSLFAGRDLVYAVSDNGTSWRSGVLLRGPLNISNWHVATAPDHVGAAVWVDEHDRSIKVLPAGPNPPASSPAGGSSGTSGTTKTPGAQRPRFLRKPEGIYGIDGLPTCASAGSTFAIIAGFAPKAGSPATGLRRVEFFLNGRLVRRTTRLPYVANMRARAIAAGRRYAVRVRLLARVKRGRAQVRTINATIGRC